MLAVINISVKLLVDSTWLDDSRSDSAYIKLVI